MSQPTTPVLERGVLAPPIRRSARLQQKNPVNPTETVDSQPRRKRKNPASQDAVSSNDEYDSTAPPKRMRTTQPGENECSPAIDKPTAASPSTSVNTALERPKARGPKPGVQFADGEPLEPVTDEVDPDEAPATAAAAAVTVEYLASRSNDSWTDIKKMPCPPEARPYLQPTYTRDRKGRVLARYPVHFALVYAFEVEALYRHLKSRRRKYRNLDMTAGLHVFAQEVYAALRLDFGDGITHSTLDDKLVYTFVMSVSNRPETLPYPAARLRKFQEIIDLQKPPTVLAFRPRPHRVRCR
ncbi:uncharacterized protein SCHCODRAFT_02558664 [Schizophyllum commune H4-8]|nr:uncharacterized protein SCHCODRAFT_02558664 [Schizophyllum commune H4-8]KAI5884904.1 hypothetical protein SCHCODRAFT_02558664 [Schizophyllum commune H4-8]